ncbi:MAG: dihydrolipoyllysine-residue acetyltransferase [Candidatus Velthaea sp.]
MAKTIELTVPDIGGFDDVPVIEVLVQAGDTIAVDAPLLTLESDKATMEVPASAAGKVQSVKVKIGDKVSQGSVIASIEIADDTAAAPVASHAPSAAPVPAAAAPAAPENPPANGAATTRELTVPDIGGFDDVPVITVLVKPGDVIGKDTPLIELESDKATMEVPSDAAGVVQDVRVKIGDKVSQGTVIATIASSAPVAAKAAPAAQPAAQASPVATASSPVPAPIIAAITPAPPSMNGSSNGGSHGTGTGPVHASPAIRRFARELGVDLHGLRGSGPNSRVTREDVQGFVKGALAGGTGKPAAGGASLGGLNLLPWPKVDFAKFGPIERKPLTRIQKLSGPNLARNWAMIPHVTQNEDADVTELEEFRKSINAEQKDVKVTMLALMLKASVAALKKYPNFNSSLDGDELVLKAYYHLGFAADTPNGLLVPVIRDVDKKGVLEIARETGELAGKARDNKLGPADMTGATFTISSLGGIGGTSFTPIINAPEVAILGACRTSVKPVWDGKAFMPRTILPLSLSYDHRVIDGASAARFAAYLAGVLADFRRTLL